MRFGKGRTGRRDDFSYPGLMAGDHIQVTLGQDHELTLTDGVLRQMQPVDMPALVVKHGRRRVDIFRRLRVIYQQTGRETDHPSLRVLQWDHQPAAEHVYRVTITLCR